MKMGDGDKGGKKLTRVPGRSPNSPLGGRPAKMEGTLREERNGGYLSHLAPPEQGGRDSPCSALAGRVRAQTGRLVAHVTGGQSVTQPKCRP